MGVKQLSSVSSVVVSAVPSTPPLLLRAYDSRTAWTANDDDDDAGGGSRTAWTDDDDDDAGGRGGSRAFDVGSLKGNLA